MANLLVNDFDAETTGALPSGWADVGTSEGGTDDTGKATVQTAPVGWTGKALRILQDTVTAARSKKTFTRQTSGTIDFSLKFLIGSNVSTNYRWLDFNLYDGTTTAGDEILRVLQADSRVLLRTKTIGQILAITGLTAGTACTASGSIDIATKKLTSFVLNGTTYDNAGAGYGLYASMAGIDRLYVDGFSPLAVGGEYQWLDNLSVTTTAPATQTYTADALVAAHPGTAYSSGTHQSVACGTDRYAQVTLVYEGASGNSITVERSSDNATWVTATVTTTSLGSGNWQIVDKRPTTGTQSVALGSTIYYRVKQTVSSVLSPPTASVSAVANVDVPAIETARATLLHSLISAQSGGYYPSATSDVSGGEKYPGQWVLSMAYAYYLTGTTSYKTDAVNEFNYLVSTITNADGLLVWPGDPTNIERDYHFRNILYCNLAARLFRGAGDDTTANTIITQCDVWAQAAFDSLNGGTPTSSITRHGWDANNASGQTNNTAWSAGATITAGAIRKPTVNNARLYRARNSGTTHATTEPTWPTTVGSTVTDNGITWVCTSGTGSVFSSLYTNAAGYASAIAADFDVNQVVEVAATYALLMVEPSSAFYTAGTYRTKALTVTQDAVNLLMAYQITGGKVPIGDPIPPADGRAMYDTIYGGFTLTTAALIFRHFSASVHQDLSLYLGGVLDWFDTLTTEPLAATHYDSATQIGFPEAEFRNAGYRVMGRTNPLNNIWNTAAFNTSTDRWGWYSQAGSPSTSSPSTISDGVQARSLLGAAWATAAIPGITTYTADAIVKVTSTKTYTADALVKTQPTKTYTADAIVTASGTGAATLTYTADAVIVSLSQTVTYTADAVITPIAVTAIPVDVTLSVVASTDVALSVSEATTVTLSIFPA